jgi:hypothetical protein
MRTTQTSLSKNYACLLAQNPRIKYAKIEDRLGGEKRSAILNNTRDFL